jgi:PilZ domain-containing protein
MQERRSEVRLLCADLIEVHWKDASGKNHRTPALLEDISVSGACLQMETPLPLGARVCWSGPFTRGGKARRPKEFFGVVRYCEYQEIGYYLGVEFASTSKWSRRKYRPRHLLDWKRLLGQTGS